MNLDAYYKNNEINTFSSGFIIVIFVQMRPTTIVIEPCGSLCKNTDLASNPYLKMRWRNISHESNKQHEPYKLVCHFLIEETHIRTIDYYIAHKEQCGENL